MACGLLMTLPAAAQADIFRWDNGQLIPGTQGITPGPRVDLSSWNSPQRNLRFAHFPGSPDLTGANFSSSWLDDSRFYGAILTNADLSGTNLTGVQLFSFNAELSEGATLTNANLAGATVTGADFSLTTSHGFTKEQLYSTASYQQRNLRGIGLRYNDLTGWDFSGQDLTGAAFLFSTLTNANLSRTILTDAQLEIATLTNANLAGAVVAGANFGQTTSRGFTKEQLYSTASYQQKNLRGIALSDNNLTGWDFSGQDLTGADFTSARLANANFNFADLRGSRMSSGPFQTRNTIRELGAINGLDLAAAETLIVRDSTIDITVRNSMIIVSGSTLELVIDDADWGSTIAVAAGVTPDLGGTLRVRFAAQANLAHLLGTTFDLFNWPEVLDINNRFDAIELPPGTQWDLSQLYVTGKAQLTAIPEPSAVALLACGTAACILGWAFRQRRHGFMR
jgi:uncharacterized protein YjbI with pentapeptide repeats